MGQHPLLLTSHIRVGSDGLKRRRARAAGATKSIASAAVYDSKDANKLSASVERLHELWRHLEGMAARAGADGPAVQGDGRHLVKCKRYGGAPRRLPNGQPALLRQYL